MKKEDILQKARSEGNGEYEERIQGRIMTRSALAVVALCAFFWLARVFQADRLGLAEVGAWELPAIATGYAAFVHLWMYARLKTRPIWWRPVLSGWISGFYRAVFGRVVRRLP